MVRPRLEWNMEGDDVRFAQQFVQVATADIVGDVNREPVARENGCAEGTEQLSYLTADSARSR